MPYSRVEKFINKAVQNHELPGAVLAVANATDLVYSRAFGMAHTVEGIPMTTQSIFDCASLTKIVATTSAVLVLLERGQLDLDDALYDYFPSMKKLHGDVTIRHLLTHTSGFQSEIKFYEQHIAYGEVIAYLSQITDRNAINKNVIYSDVNYILLGMLVEKVAQASLAEFTIKNVFEPLGMQHTRFNPPIEWQQRFAATEYRDYLNQHQWGNVHDENAHHFGGVSGHAGLFSTAEDLAKFAQAFMKNSPSIFKEQTKVMAKQSHTKPHKEQRGLGWQLYSQPSFSGQYLQDGFGHTGFTGTSLWISEEKQLAIILLTNRVHFGRSCDIQRFRRIVHNLIALEND